MKQFRSLYRAIRRGHIQGQINGLHNTIELFRKTATSNKHTVYLFSVDLNRNGNS